jgi:hypothetical protein
LRDDHSGIILWRAGGRPCAGGRQDGGGKQQAFQRRHGFPFDEWKVVAGDGECRSLWALICSDHGRSAACG